MEARAALAALGPLGLLVFCASALLEPPALLVPPRILLASLWTLLAFALLPAVESLLYQRYLRIPAVSALRRAVEGDRPLAFPLVFVVAFAPGLSLAPMIGRWLVLDRRAWLGTLALGVCLCFTVSFVLERLGRPVLSLSADGWFPRSVVTLLTDAGEPPVDVEATCSGERAP